MMQRRMLGVWGHAIRRGRASGGGQISPSLRAVDSMHRGGSTSRCAADCGSQGRTSSTQMQRTEQVSVQEQRGIGTGEISLALQLHARRGWSGTDWTSSGFVVRPECWAGRAAGVWVRSTMRRCPLCLQIPGPANLATERVLAWLDMLRLMLTASAHPPVRLRPLCIRDTHNGHGTHALQTAGEADVAQPRAVRAGTWDDTTSMTRQQRSPRFTCSGSDCRWLGTPVAVRSPCSRRQDEVWLTMTASRRSMRS